MPLHAALGTGLLRYDGLARARPCGARRPARPPPTTTAPQTHPLVIPARPNQTTTTEATTAGRPATPGHAAPDAQTPPHWVPACAGATTRTLAASCRCRCQPAGWRRPVRQVQRQGLCSVAQDLASDAMTGRIPYRATRDLEPGDIHALQALRSASQIPLTTG